MNEKMIEKMIEKIVKSIPVMKEESNVFSILMKAVAGEETRYFMNALRYDHEEKKLIATDGRRMHILKVERPSMVNELPDFDTWAWYEKGILTFFTPDAIKGHFPDWKRILPLPQQLDTNGREYSFIKNATRKHSVKKEQTTRYELPQFYRDHTFLSIDLDYLLDIQGRIYTVKVSNDQEFKARRPVLFESGGLTCLIMPTSAWEECPDFHPVQVREKVAM